MRLPTIPLVVLDTETTGFVPSVHRVIEYACAIIEDGKITKEYSELLSGKSDDEIPPYVQVLTHITPADLKGKPTFLGVVTKLKAMMPKDAVIVGQNIKFDLSMLKGEGWDLSDQPCIDTAMLASLVFPELASYSLSFVSTALGLDHTPKHRALGDVRATVALLSKCYERLLELPAKDIARIQELAARGPVGYQKFFSSLETGKAEAEPKWLTHKRTSPTRQKKAEAHELLAPPKAGMLQAVHEPFDSQYLSRLALGAPAGTWIAVKNLEATIRRLPVDHPLTVLPPPEFVLSEAGAKALLEQKKYTADELTLAIKLHLYDPFLRSDLPLHGEENAVWSGKLAAHATDKEYVALRKLAAKGPTLVGHHELLRLTTESPSLLEKAKHVIIDDASMLEDTATQSFGWTCLVPTLRAAAAWSDALTKCADIVELWIEKTRAGTDGRYLIPVDLETREAEQLTELVSKILTGEVPPNAKRALEHLLLILDRQNLGGRIAWIEAFADGTKAVKSVPEDIASLLESRLYQVTPTSLLIPQGGEAELAAIVPPTQPIANEKPIVPPPTALLALTGPQPMDQILAAPTGKTVVLVGSKRMIEDLYTKHALRCEKDGITLLCQGFSGGQGRMQAEFALASTPAVLIITAWMYETLELPPATIEKLVLQTLPFDHPSHPVFSRRAGRYKDPFSGYSLPRLKQRLFRILRTFNRHAKPDSIVQVLDDRLINKPYGRIVSTYLHSLLPAQDAGQKAKAVQMALL